MARQLKRLLKHYGIDEEKPKASKQLIKRIKADMNRYIAQIEEAIESDIVHNPRTDEVNNRVRYYMGDKVIKGQSSISGRSLGRSTGPVKKSGANKRSGGGKEHGECLGASSRVSKKTVPMYQVEPTFKRKKQGKKLDTQLNDIVEAYTALLELVK
tara:strand:+ start:5361 stop:5828 length:468 start_codon:yes stop_codon:yes gene_type:complete